jgi:hypothetical protein
MSEITSSPNTGRSAVALTSAPSIQQEQQQQEDAPWMRSFPYKFLPRTWTRSLRFPVLVALLMICLSYTSLALNVRSMFQLYSFQHGHDGAIWRAVAFNCQNACTFRCESFYTYQVVARNLSAEEPCSKQCTLGLQGKLPFTTPPQGYGSGSEQVFAPPGWSGTTTRASPATQASLCDPVTGLLCGFLDPVESWPPADFQLHGSDVIQHPLMCVGTVEHNYYGPQLGFDLNAPQSWQSITAATEDQWTSYGSLSNTNLHDPDGGTPVSMFALSELLLQTGTSPLPSPPRQAFIRLDGGDNLFSEMRLDDALLPYSRNSTEDLAPNGFGWAHPNPTGDAPELTCQCGFHLPTLSVPTAVVSSADAASRLMRVTLLTSVDAILAILLAKEALKLMAFFILVAVYSRSVPRGSRPSKWMLLFSKHVLMLPCWLLGGRSYREKYLTSNNPGEELYMSVLDLFLATLPLFYVNLLLMIGDELAYQPVDTLAAVTLAFNCIMLLHNITTAFTYCCRAVATQVRSVSPTATSQGDHEQASAVVSNSKNGGLTIVVSMRPTAGMPKKEVELETGQTRATNHSWAP